MGGNPPAFSPPPPVHGGIVAVDVDRPFWDFLISIGHRTVVSNRIIAGTASPNCESMRGWVMKIARFGGVVGACHPQRWNAAVTCRRGKSPVIRGSVRDTKSSSKIGASSAGLHDFTLWHLPRWRGPINSRRDRPTKSRWTRSTEGQNGQKR